MIKLNKHFLTSLMSILFLASCSKKALTELASNESQNNSSNADDGGNNGNSDNQSAQQSDFILLNVNDQLTNEKGTIVKFNIDTDSFEMIYDDVQDRKFSYNFMDNMSYQFRLPGIRHSSEEVKGNYLIIGDQNDQNFTNYQLGFFNEATSSLNVFNLSFTNTEIAYSGHFAMLTASDGFNYVVSPTNYVEVDSLLGLDGTTESLKTTNIYFPLGKGIYLANSFPQNSANTDKFLLFSADMSQQTIKVDTYHQVYQVLKFSEESAIFLTKNNAGDQALYYYRYSDHYLNKIYEALVADGQNIKINEKVFLDTNNNYNILIRNSALFKHELFQVNNSTGIMTSVASQITTDSTSGLFTCDQYSFDRSNNYSFKSTIIEIEKIYTTCKKTSNEYLVIEYNFTLNTIKSYSYATSGSEGSLFSYKGEQYITNVNGAYKWEIINDTLVLGTLNQGHLFTDNLAQCNNQAPTGYNCTNLQFYGMGGERKENNYFLNKNNVSIVYSITDGTTPLLYFNIFSEDDFKVSVTSIGNLYLAMGKMVKEFYSQTMYGVVDN